MPEWKPSLGAVHDRGVTTFRVWAPDHERVELVIARTDRAGTDTADVAPMTRDPCGYWIGRDDNLSPGTLYKYRLNGDDGQVFPDPASRFQPRGVHGPSMVVDPSRFQWTDGEWHPPSLDRIVFYELHVGTFSPQGTFRGVIDRLPYLVDLGITAIELMPVADFPGDRNWGYDGVALFAPARCYGAPDDLRALVDASHRHGLSVFLDVVYNHLGPDGAYAVVFSPYYFTDAHNSPWGRGVNLDGPHAHEVRQFFIENAQHWVNEYHVDGLRLDATHAMHDSSDRHFLAELTSTVRASAHRTVTCVAEDHRNLAQIVHPVEAGGYGLDAVWADDFHHHVRVRTANEREGYYADFTGATADLATTLRQGWFFTGQPSLHRGEPRGTEPIGLRPQQFVICIQNHDQIGNRADGARLNHEIDPATYRAVSVLLLLAPETPLLFMGQEWAASTPFLFFTDHHEELGRQVTCGRREEFRAFAAFADVERRWTIPDPQDAETFERSRLIWPELSREPHVGIKNLYRRLLTLRRRVLDDLNGGSSDGPGAWEAWALGEHGLGFGFTRANLIIIVQFSAGTVTVPLTIRPDVVITSEDPDVVTDAQPITMTRRTRPRDERDRSDSREEIEIGFARPGAIVIGSGAL